MPELPMEILESTWPHLKKHYTRASLFLVSGVSLLEVAQAVSQDNKTRIAGLLQAEQLRRPTPEEVRRWASPGEESSLRFSFVIVQPFVFVEQPVEDC